MPLCHAAGLDREPLDSCDAVISKLQAASSLVVPCKQPRFTGKTDSLGQSHVAGWYRVASRT